LNEELNYLVLGSHLPLVSPALEFVKAVTFVMALDPVTRNEISSLKRMLLAQVFA
jgi:hypothetical protein